MFKIGHSRRKGSQHGSKGYSEEERAVRRAERASRRVEREERRSKLLEMLNDHESKKAQEEARRQQELRKDVKEEFEDKLEERAENIAVTFENILSHLKTCNEPAISKSSVADMVADLYRWISYDKNMQISLPSGHGTNQSLKMWPEGARISSRRPANSSAKPGERALNRDVDYDTMSVISSTVASSIQDQHVAGFSRPTYMIAAPSQGRQTFGYSQPQSFATAPGRFHPTLRSMSEQEIDSVPHVTARMSSVRIDDQDEVYEDDAAEYGFPPVVEEPRRYSILDRGSVNGGTGNPPPVIAPDSPVPVKKTRKVVRRVAKPKVGAATRDDVVAYV